MTRSILTLAAAVGLTSILAAQGCKQTGVGDPCIPEIEYDTTFNGFDQSVVEIESRSFQCQTRLCLANHFQGRVSCVYGQDSTGMKLPDGTTDFTAQPGDPGGACTVPGTKHTAAKAITGDPSPNNKVLAQVLPQCLGRQAAKTVYCSCRCANIDGKTDDGANYCTCPDGYQCSQLVDSIGGNFNEGLTGAYCIQSGTAYDKANPCTDTCDPTTNVCNTTN